MPTRYQNGWNAALASVKRDLPGLAALLESDGLQERALECVGALCEASRYNWPRRTNDELARKYGTSRRTIIYWRKEGCPFELGQPHVLRWLASRRYVPVGTQIKFASQLQHRRTRQVLAEARALLRLVFGKKR